MKILILSQYFWPESFRINDVATELRRKGHQVTVLTGIPNYPQGRFSSGYGWFRPLREDYRGVEIIRVPLIARGNGGGLRLFLNYVSFAAAASILGPWLAPSDVEAIFVFEPSPITVGLPAIILGWLRSAPVLLWVQDLWPESLSATNAIRSPRLLGLVGLLVRSIYRRCDRILIQSRAFDESVRAHGGRQEAIFYYPNTAEDIYRPVRLGSDDPDRRSLPDGFRVMFAGNIGAAQDFPNILDAAERLRERVDIKWIIVGDGRMRAWVEREIERRELRATVFLKDRQPVESMPRLFASADALLVTLRKDSIFALTVPSKVQSYLACGRPIIAALDGEGARIVDESLAGISCPAGDSKALAAAVLRLSGMPPSARDEMGSRGLAYFRSHFGREMLLEKLEGWLQESIVRSRGRAASRKDVQRV